MTALNHSEQDRPAYGLRIARLDDGDDAVIRLYGELELANAALLRDAVERALASSGGQLVLDLRALDFLDSTGMHALVEANNHCVETERSLTLLLEPGSVRRTLDVCGLLDILDHVPPQAVAA